MILTADQLHKIAQYSTPELRTAYLPHLNAVMAKFNINTPLRLAAFLAQILHESASLSRTEEEGDGKAYEMRRDLGNLEPEALAAAHAQHSTTGAFYKGHGLIQITGYENHKKCGEALGIDCVNHPTLLCGAEHAAMSAGWFWVQHNLNVYADVGKFDEITRRINGGFNGKKQRDELYALAKRVLGVA